MLVQHAGKVLTHKFLFDELWDETTDTQYLRVLHAAASTKNRKRIRSGRSIS